MHLGTGNYIDIFALANLRIVLSLPLAAFGIVFGQLSRKNSLQTTLKISNVE